MKRLFSTLVLLASLLPAVSAQHDPARIRLSDDVEIVKLSNRAYLHISVTEIPSWGSVASNGLILVDKGKAFLFDTPVTEEQTATVLRWVTDSLHARVTGFVPNHWHSDCMGGIACLHRRKVKSYANRMTAEIARREGLPVPQHEFGDSLRLKVGKTEIFCYYPGGGHSTDNIAVWIPAEKILFAGCMVKALNATSPGNMLEGDRYWLV